MSLSDLTPDMWMTLAVLLAAIVLFISEKIPVDLVALLVLVSVVLLGLVGVEDALRGFGNPAVITIAAVFVLSGALQRTGIANMVGQQVLRFARGGEARLTSVIMMAVGAMSGFMNDIGVAALMLPVVMDIARRTNRSPSKLLIPLSFAALMGGKMTLIGTAANILLSGALIAYGYEGFSLFDFFPVGFAALLAGIAYMLLVGRHLLPERAIAVGEGTDETDLRAHYGVRDRLHLVHLPVDSPMDGVSLRRSRLGSALDLNVIAIIRGGRMLAAPGPETELRGDDRLLVEGNLERFTALVGQRHLAIANDLEEDCEDGLVDDEIGLAEAVVAPGGRLDGHSLLDARFRQRYGAIVVAVRHQGRAIVTKLEHVGLEEGDVILLQGRKADFADLVERQAFASVEPLSAGEAAERYGLREVLLPLRITEGSILEGTTLAESRMGDAYALSVLCVLREGRKHLLPPPDMSLRVGDVMLVKATRSDLEIARGLAGLEFDEGSVPRLRDMEQRGVGLMEAMLSPHSALDGKTPREIRFRDRFGVSLMAVSRADRVIGENRRDVSLRFGDALLLFGPYDRLRDLAQSPDFLALTESVQKTPRLEKAWPAGLILLGVMGVVIAGWQPIAIAALAGSALMILAGCLNMREAYDAIEWPAIVLVAGMLPLGVAMEQSGLAELVAQQVLDIFSGMGTLALMSGLFLITVVAAQVMPTAVVAVLMAPITINAAQELGASPHALLMLVAMAVSSSFMTPVGHAVNVLVMGPGNYRFTDYARVGLPLTIVIYVTVMLVLPLFWPIFPTP